MIETFKAFLADDEAPEMFISGIAGTGKTTELGSLIKYCIQNGLTSVTCAYTHKAVGVLRSKVPRKLPNNILCTLHSYLKKCPTINDKATKLKEVDGNTQVAVPAQVHVLFIDEFSMIGERDYEDILAMQYNEEGELILKVVYIGDPNQLPPVKDVQSVIPKEPYWVKLTKVYRQAGDNPLIDNLVQLNDFINGVRPKPLAEHKHFVRGVDIVKGYKEFKGSKILLAYTNECVEDLNALVQGRTRPEIGDELFSSTLRKLYILDHIDGDCDNVISIRGELVEQGSKYRTLETLKDIEGVEFFVLTDKQEHESQRAIVFGYDTFLQRQQKLAKTAVKINKKIERMYKANAKDWAKKNWTNPLAKERATAWREYLTFKNNVLCIDFTHAMTVHKSQGSTYDKVFLDTDDMYKCAKNDYSLYLKLLYVAISRAADTVYTN